MNAHRFERKKSIIKLSQYAIINYLPIIIGKIIIGKIDQENLQPFSTNNLLQCADHCHQAPSCLFKILKI